MDATNIEFCEAGKDRLLSRRVIVKFIYIMLYFSIYVINRRRINAYFNPQAEVKEENKQEEKLSLIRPMEEDQVVDLDDRMETIYVYDFEGTGEQLRRLRAYNPKVDGETDEQYDARILDMAYQEDAEEERQKVSNAAVANANEIVPVSSANEVVPVSSANEVVVPLEKDVNVWYTIEDGKCRYKGEWKNGLPNGKGIKHFYKTDSYIYGNFVDGFAEGHGKQTFEQTWEKTVPYYEGEFKRNNYQGKGEYHYGDGDYYKGDWKDGKYHGQGAAYSKRLDRTWVGEYKNDEKVDGNWVRGEI
jgi:hypothetical protein